MKNIKNIYYEEMVLNETYRFGGEIIKLINDKFYTLLLILDILIFCLNKLNYIIDKILLALKNKINSSKIYLTGLSMGAWGAWNLVFEHPDLFAAMIPIAGFVDRVPMVENCKIKNIPIRIYHGQQDDVVSVNYAIAIYDKLKDFFDQKEIDDFIYEDFVIENYQFHPRISAPVAK